MSGKGFHTRLIAVLSVVVVAIASIPNVAAQDYKFEIGGGIGLSGYLGDANKSSLLKNVGFAAQGVFKYIPDYRWTIRGDLSTAHLSGNSAKFSDVLPDGNPFSFSSQIYNLGARVEFNFFNYGIGYTYKRLHRISPYLTVGLGATLASCNGNSSVAMNLPVGAGVKYKLRERINLSMEFTMTKVFGDKVDGYDTGNVSGIKNSFAKNTDWFSLLMVGITYEFGKRCKVCHYVD